MEAVIADQKLTSLSAFTPAAADILYGVDDPGGTPVSGKFTIEALLDVLKAPYLKTNEGLISFTQTLTGSNTSVALYLQGDYNTSGSTSLVDLAIDDTASAATTTFIICERLDGGTVTYWAVNKDGTTQMRSGSAASPVLTFLSDPDTGLFRAGTNILGFATGGAERVRINSAGTLLQNVSGTTYQFHSENTFKAGSAQITDTNSSVAVSFSNAMPDTNYVIVLGQAVNDTFWWSSKATGGFTINRAGTSGNATVHWMARSTGS